MYVYVLFIKKLSKYYFVLISCSLSHKERLPVFLKRTNEVYDCAIFTLKDLSELIFRDVIH